MLCAGNSPFGFRIPPPGSGVFCGTVTTPLAPALELYQPGSDLIETEPQGSSPPIAQYKYATAGGVVTVACASTKPTTGQSGDNFVMTTFTDTAQKGQKQVGPETFGLTPNILTAMQDRLRDRQEIGPFYHPELLGQTESLLNVLTGDYAILMKYGVTYEEIAAALNSVKNLQSPALNSGKFEFQGAEYQVTPGFVTFSRLCPFFDCNFSTSHRITLVNPLGKKLEIDIFMIHLITAHNFFGGIKSKDRVDPERIIKFFRLGNVAKKSRWDFLSKFWYELCDLNRWRDTLKAYFGLD